MEPGFGWVDWVIIFAYMLGMFAISAFVARRQRDSEHFFLGGRSMPAWAVALSVIATSLSAATFIGAPEIAFKGDLTYLTTYGGACLAGFVVAFWFVPPLYRAGTVTIYGYLGRRYGDPARIAASVMFLLGRLLASGSRLFMSGIAFGFMWYGDTQPGQIVPAIITLGVIGTVYTAFGGIQAVIWTETIQFSVVVLAAAVSIGLLWWAIPAPAAQIFDALANADGGSKLRLFDTSMDISAPYTVWAGFFAMIVVTTSTHGVDHDLVQRVLTAKSSWRGGMALIGSMVLTIPVVFLFMVIGLLLHVYYQRPDLMGALAPLDAVTDTRRVFPQFVLNHIPFGVRGLIMAGLFSASMSTFQSAINAMASSLVADLYAPWLALRARRRGEVVTHDISLTRLSESRFAVALIGAALTVFAVLAAYLQARGGDTLINFALGVMAFALAPLLGVFLAAMFTRRGNTWSVYAALAFGVVLVWMLQPDMAPRWLGTKVAWPWWWVIVSPLCFLICAAGPRARECAAGQLPEGATGA